MAVARIVADPKWHRSAAAAFPSEERRAARELLRAAERPGLMAELGADEVRVLARIFPNDPKVVAALVAIESSEERERTRPRGVYRRATFG